MPVDDAMVINEYTRFGRISVPKIRTEYRPTWRNFVIPSDPEIRDIAKVMKNHVVPPGPPKTAQNPLICASLTL